MATLRTPKDFWIFNHIVPPGETCDSLPFEPNARSSWYANTYRSRMKAGDTAYIWMTNPEGQSGLYGYRTLAGKPYTLGNEDAYGVDVDPVDRLIPGLKHGEEPIPRERSPPKKQNFTSDRVY